MEKFNLNSLVADIIKSFKEECNMLPQSPFIKKVTEKFLIVLLSIYEITPPDGLLDDYCPSDRDRTDGIRKQLEAYVSELEEWIVIVSVQYMEVNKTIEILHPSPAAPATEDFLENVNEFRKEVEKILPEFNKTLEEYRRSYFKLHDMESDLKIKKPYSEEEDPW